MAPAHSRISSQPRSTYHPNLGLSGQAAIALRSMIPRGTAMTGLYQSNPLNQFRSSTLNPLQLSTGAPFPTNNRNICNHIANPKQKHLHPDGSSLSSLVYFYIREAIFVSLAQGFEIEAPRTPDGSKIRARTIEAWFNAASVSNLNMIRNTLARSIINEESGTPVQVSNLELLSINDETPSTLSEANHRHPSRDVKTAVYRYMGNGTRNREEVSSTLTPIRSQRVGSQKLGAKNEKDFECECSKARKKFLVDVLAAARYNDRKQGHKYSKGLKGVSLGKVWKYDSDEDEDDDEGGGGVPIGNVQTLYEELEEAKYIYDFLLEGDPYAEDITLSEFLELLKIEDRVVEQTWDEDTRMLWMIARGQSRLEARSVRG